MLYKVEARNPQGSLLELTLEDVTDGYIVEDVEGLGPVKATLVSSSFAQQDGVQYHSSRREARNLVLKIGLEPDYATTTVWDLRQNLYNFFMTKSQVSLRFYMTTGLTVDITGRVESCEPSIFSKEPQMDISILCFDPDFLPLASVTVAGDTVEDMTETLIECPGSVETGIEFVLNVDRTLAEFTIYHRAPDDTIRSLDFEENLLAGDVIVISTIPGSKFATLTRSSTVSSMLHAVSPQASWIQLEPGDNHIRVYAVGLPIPYEITYLPRYGGL